MFFKESVELLRRCFRGVTEGPKENQIPPTRAFFLYGLEHFRMERDMKIAVCQNEEYDSVTSFQSAFPGNWIVVKILDGAFNPRAQRRVYSRVIVNYPRYARYACMGVFCHIIDRRLLHFSAFHAVAQACTSFGFNIRHDDSRLSALRALLGSLSVNSDLALIDSGKRREMVYARGNEYHNPAVVSTCFVVFPESHNYFLIV